MHGITENHAFAAGQRNLLMLVGTALLSACTGDSVCSEAFANPDCPLGAVILPSGSSEFVAYKDLDNKLNVEIRNRHGDDESVQISLIPKAAPSAELSLAKLTDKISPDYHYILDLNSDLLKPFQPGYYFTLFRGSKDLTERKVQVDDFTLIIKQRPFQYKDPVVYAQQGAKENRALVEQLGMVGNAVITLNSGIDNTSYPAKQVFLYNFDSDRRSLSASPATGYLSSPFLTETLVGFARANLFLLTQTMSNLYLRKCNTLPPQSMTDCPQVDAIFRLPVEVNKALLVTSDGKLVVRVDAVGRLLQAIIKAPLLWAAVPSTVAASATATVKLASGDVNADGFDDLMAVTNDKGKQTAQIFFGQDNGSFIEDPTWSKALQAALPDSAITALAAGDVDTDGYADVVLGRGLELAVMQNLQGQFTRVWSAKLDPAMAGTQIDALAVGRLVGSEASKSLDVVAVSNSGYSAGTPAKNTMYLHAFQAVQIAP